MEQLAKKLHQQAKNKYRNTTRKGLMDFTSDSRLANDGDVLGMEWSAVAEYFSQFKCKTLSELRLFIHLRAKVAIELDCSISFFFIFVWFGC